MKYTMYRLTFPVGVHIGNRSLEDSKYTISADTLFSALYIEALKREDNEAKQLLESIKQGEILISDAFPYIGETNYLPKPLLRIETDDINQGDSIIKKAFKGISYIPINQMEQYLQGEFDAVKEKSKLSQLGKSVLKTSASIHGKEETEPYHIGVYYFNEGCGLYFIVATQNEEDEDLMYDLIDALSFSGIGGKRSSGLGHFEIENQIELDNAVFEQKSSNYMSLSISLPQTSELQSVLDCAQYQVQKRSGFVFSSDYASEQRKKKDIFMLASGSCFKQKYEGDIYDVSDGGKHPVYRYAKPIFWGL